MVWTGYPNGRRTAATLLAGGLTLDDLLASGRLDSGRGRTARDHHGLALKYRDMIRLNSGIALPADPTGQASRQLPRPADIVEALGLW